MKKHCVQQTEGNQKNLEQGPRRAKDNEMRKIRTTKTRNIEMNEVKCATGLARHDNIRAHGEDRGGHPAVAIPPTARLFAAIGLAPAGMVSTVVAGVAAATVRLVQPLVLRSAAGVHEKVAHGGQLQAQLLSDRHLHLLRRAFRLLEDRLQCSSLQVGEHQPRLLRPGTLALLATNTTTAATGDRRWDGDVRVVVVVVVVIATSTNMRQHLSVVSGHNDGPAERWARCIECADRAHCLLLLLPFAG